MSRKKRANPLAGLSIKGFDQIADEIIAGLEGATVDLSDPDDRLLLRDTISSRLRGALDWDFMQKMEAACRKAMAHVLDLMGDDDYQEQKAEARRKAWERRQARLAKQRDPNEKLRNVVPISERPQ